MSQKSDVKFKFTSKIKVILGYVLSCCLLSGCYAPHSNPFPQVTQPSLTPTISSSESSSRASETSAEETSTRIVLKVAAPISNKTVIYLTKLYTAKVKGLFPEGETGASVSFEDLDAIEPMFDVDILQTPSTGVSDQTVAQWKSNNISPDIVYTNALSLLQEKGEILSLSDYLYSNPLILPTHSYLSMLQACTIEHQLYGIPYRAAAKILFVNQAVLALAGVETVPFEMDVNTLTSVSEKIKAVSDQESLPENRDFAFYGISGLLPFLPSSYSNNAGWFMFDGEGFDFRNPGFSQAVNYLRSYVNAGYAVESMSKEDQQQAFGDFDPRLSGRVAMWVGGTEDIPLWSQHSTLDFSLAQIPASSLDSPSRLALTVYPLCVLSSTHNPQLASDFATFMSLDNDAILLADRLDQKDGFLPVVSSSTVWNTVITKQSFGDNLLLLRNKMPDAICNPATNRADIATQIDQMLGSYSEMMLDSKVDLESVIVSLSTYQPLA